MLESSQTHGGDYVELNVSYTQVGLLAYQVSRLDNLEDLIKVSKEAQAKDKELKRMMQLATGELPVRKRASTSKAGKRPPAKRIRRPMKGKPDPGDAESEEVAADLPPEVLDDEAGPASDSASDGDSVASSGFEHDDGLGGEPGAEPVLAPAVVDRGSIAADRAVDIEPPPAPPPPPYTFNPGSGRVEGPGSVYWGRISIIKPGLPVESLSVYCSQHGCAICKRVTSGVPGQAEILKWIADGRDLPKGKAYQARHKAMWPK